jgi:hypothetical protein
LSPIQSNRGESRQTHQIKEAHKMSKLTIRDDIVTTAKQELIEKINANIDMDRIRDICAEQYGLKTIDAIEFKEGDIIAQEAQISYKLEFVVCFSLPLLIDENGNFRGIASGDAPNPETPEARVDEIGQQAGHMAQNL